MAVPSQESVGKTAAGGHRPGAGGIWRPAASEARYGRWVIASIDQFALLEKRVRTIEGSDEAGVSY